MNASPDNSLRASAGPRAGSAALDDTLRVIAQAPVPAGIEERVHAALRAAPRHSRMLVWPAAETALFWGSSNWLRAAAAASIVLAVAGGGWGVYMHVQRPGSKVIVAPLVQPASGGGFSSASAIRTPATVKGPVVAQPESPAGAHRRKHTAARAAAVQPVPSPGAKN